MTIDKSSIQVPLQDSELPCCPCEDNLGGSRAVLQPVLASGENIACPIGVSCNNGTITSPINNGTVPPPTTPHVPKPRGPLGNNPSACTNGNPCSEGTCFSDCDCGCGRRSLLNIAFAHEIDPTKQPQESSPPELRSSPLDSFLPNAAATPAASLSPCPEGLCTPDCECFVDKLLAFINPGTPLASMPRVCGPRECSADCICRDDLIKTARVVGSLRKHDSISKPKVGDQNIIVGKSDL
ncbi:hypothetical protein EG328_005111 [Venturia inaequalis]|uniref:Uncharacterized protein n=1 Tax=Venturia inaequalis TaxID=5025 RepID=A0A8H3UMU7_VENIN|nr:hypothetical protein EG328_005111 [Venturia inaequalis]